MRSRSRSRTRRRPSSRTGSRSLVRHRKSDPIRSARSRSRSTSKTRRGVALKRKSESHRSTSTSPKRRHRDGERGEKQKEVPRKRAADSTDSPSKNKVHKGSKNPSSAKHRDKHKASPRKDKKQHSDKSSKHRRESIEEGEIDESPNAERRFDQTEVSLDDRFTTTKTKPFIPDENVTIEIERSVAGRAVPFAIPPFWSDAVLIARRLDEGRKPLSEREEFLRRVDDSDEERRVVKVKKSSIPENFDVRRDRIHGEGHKALSSRDSRSRRDEPPSHREEGSRRRRMEREDNYQAKIGLVVTRNRVDDGRSRPIQRSVTTSVGRQFLLPAAAAMARNLNTEHLHSQRDSVRTAAPSANFLSGYQSMPTMTPQPAPLPDFAHRPDKYSYEEWKDHPELIPKGRSYYEHDDRDASDDWRAPRFRGRGRFIGASRGRGIGRGFSRGSVDSRRRPPPYRPRSPFSRGGGGEWKHDKFEELEASEPASRDKAK